METNDRVEALLLKLKKYNITFSSPHPNQDDEEIVRSVLTTHEREVREEINKKYWLEPKRSKKEVAKENAWNNLGNTLRRGV